MTREALWKMLLIVPSSLFFFLLVPLASWVVGKRLDALLGLPTLELGEGGMVVVAFLFIFGAYYVLGSIRGLFIEGGGIPLGDVLPANQSTELVTGGVYGSTRNPMLFGYLLILAAQGIALNSLTMAFMIPTIFIGLWSLWLKNSEEPRLEARFGEAYIEYRRITPFLIPRPLRNTTSREHIYSPNP